MGNYKQIMWIVLGVGLWLGTNLTTLLADEQMKAPSLLVLEAQALPPTPIFNYPVVEDTQISSYFDHNATAQQVTFYNNRSSQSGFTFSCPAFDDIAPGVGNVWVGCEGGTDNEANCDNTQELWYDNHRGTDFEYAANWHTGPACDMARFEVITPEIYAPAAGLVDLVGEGHPFNGNFIRLYHDLNGDGNYYNDGLRSYYLHFANNGIAVDEGDIIQAGDLLGYGGMTGLTWTPHLHFEVQLYTAKGWQPVDPFGWTGPAGGDPWIVPNALLWVDQAQASAP
jgi:murein DD-endopeptidase MepM/ murein hydrolase activator NlpD